VTHHSEWLCPEASICCGQEPPLLVPQHPLPRWPTPPLITFPTGAKVASLPTLSLCPPAGVSTVGCSFWGWAGVGEGTGEGTGEAGAAGSFSSLVLPLLWFLSSGPAGLGLSFASSFLRTRTLGDAVVPRGDGGFGGSVCPGPGLGQGEAGLCQDVEGEDGRALDLGLREKGKIRTGGHRTLCMHIHTEGDTSSQKLAQHLPPIRAHKTVSFPFSAYVLLCGYLFICESLLLMSVFLVTYPLNKSKNWAWFSSPKCPKHPEHYLAGHSFIHSASIY
jgi:hypothetical protein